MSHDSEGAICAIRPVLVQNLCKECKENDKTCPALAALDRIRNQIVVRRGNDIMKEWGISDFMELFGKPDLD